MRTRGARIWSLAVEAAGGAPRKTSGGGLGGGEKGREGGRPRGAPFFRPPPPRAG
jgi:hypothetical protein